MSAAVVARTVPLEPPSDETHACPKCGSIYGGVSQDDKRRIAELEAQVKLLTEKATAAVDKLADYEDQLHQLRSQTAASGSNSNSSSGDGSNSNAPGSKPSRFSLLTGRRPANPAAPLSGSPSAEDRPSSRRESDLQAALRREQEARQRAEGKLSEMNTEIEDLSVQLFQQANEMVATERKARAKLEERVVVLEQRDDEKRKRLERLEGAVKRIERVRTLLAT